MNAEEEQRAELTHRLVSIKLVPCRLVSTIPAIRLVYSRSVSSNSTSKEPSQ